jgi:hypothetical protein
MNAFARALVDDLRTNWRRRSVLGAAVLVALVVVYKLVVITVLTDENRRAGEEIVAAIEAFKQQNKRYPEKLAQLQPKYLGKIPLPAPGTNFVYAASPDGTAAWFGYQTQQDTFNEYDTRTRKWQRLEYEDSEALRVQAREFVLGPK